MKLLNAIGIGDAPEFPFPRCHWLDEWAITRGGKPGWEITPEDIAAVASKITDRQPRFIDLEGGYPGYPPEWLCLDPVRAPLEVVQPNVELVLEWMRAALATRYGVPWRFYEFPSGAMWYGNNRRRRAAHSAMDQLLYGDLHAELENSQLELGLCMDFDRFDDDEAYELNRRENVDIAVLRGKLLSIIYSPRRKWGRDGELVDEATFASDLQWFAANLRAEDELVIWHAFHGPDGRPLKFDPSWPWVGILCDFAASMTAGGGTADGGGA